MENKRINTMLVFLPTFCLTMASWMMNVLQSTAYVQTSFNWCVIFGSLNVAGLLFLYGKAIQYGK